MMLILLTKERTFGLTITGRLNDVRWNSHPGKGVLLWFLPLFTSPPTYFPSIFLLSSPFFELIPVLSLVLDLSLHPTLCGTFD
jgi:hypothetical protein